jgi:hypothetical protein
MHIASALDADEWSVSYAFCYTTTDPWSPSDITQDELQMQIFAGNDMLVIQSITLLVY